MTGVETLKALVADLADTYEVISDGAHDHYDPQCGICDLQRRAYLVAKALASEEVVEKMATASCMSPCRRKDCVEQRKCVMGLLSEEITDMRAAIAALLESVER